MPNVCTHSFAVQLLTDQAIKVWQAGNDISFDLAAALIEMGVDVAALEKEFVR